MFSKVLFVTNNVDSWADPGLQKKAVHDDSDEGAVGDTTNTALL